MAHMIKRNDFIVTLNSEPVSWHGLDKRVDEITFENSPLNHAIIERHPVIYLNGKTTSLKPCDDDEREEKGQILKKYLIGQRDDSPEWIISCVNQTFEPFGNSELWDLMRETMEGFNYHISTVGTLRNGKRRFISCKLNDESDASWRYYIGFHDGLDGGLSLTLNGSTIRTVCENTQRFSINNSDHLETRRHTKNFRDDIPMMVDSVKQYIDGFTEFREVYAKLQKSSIDDDTAQALITGIMAKGQKEISSVIKNRIPVVHGLFRFGKGNHGKTLADVYNGFTEFYTHNSRQSKKPNPQKQFESSEFGIDADEKEKVLNIFYSDSLLDAFADAGSKLLKENEIAFA
jgi:hypothetical protein